MRLTFEKSCAEVLSQQLLSSIYRRLQGLSDTTSLRCAMMSVRVCICCSYKVGKPLPKGQPALPWQRGQQANSTAPVVPLSRDDFLAAIVTDEGHEKLAQAGRAWRQVSRLFLSCPSQSAFMLLVPCSF